MQKYDIDIYPLESEEPRSGSVSPGLGDLHRHTAADVELLGAERGGERGRDRNEEQAGERRKGGGPRRPQCRPSCCPRADCTKTTCPQCYARMVRSPATCPCVDIGGQQPDTLESSQLTVHRGGMDTLDTREFGEDTNTIRGSQDPAGDDAMKPQEQEAGGGATEGVPLCRPSCCPRADCTKTTCPSCYARMRKSPTLCPCVNTGGRPIAAILSSESYCIIIMRIILHTSAFRPVFKQKVQATESPP